MRSPASSALVLVLVACSGTTSPTPSPDASAPDASSPDAAQPDVARPDAATGDVPRDGAATCGMFGRACNLLTNAGCAPGQGCYFDFGGVPAQNVCRAAGSRGWGETCNGLYECREGFACLGNPAVCTMLCCNNDSAPCRDEARGGRPGARCAGNITNLPGMQFCLADTSCNPFAVSNNGCPAAMPRCTPIGDGATCGPQTTPTVPEGGACCTASVCAPGHVCLLGAAGTTCDPMRPTGRCRRVCDGRQANPSSVCPMGQQCLVMFNGAQVPSYFRACSPPM